MLVLLLVVEVVVAATEVVVTSIEVLKLVLGGVGDEADLKRPDNDDGLRLDELALVVLLLAEWVLKRLILSPSD